ncbi:M20 metallopeptidase family protein [Virgibacillus halodenitrificans]|uniref:M20 metallopeptidase family protein n=1 Tax=Virgibacillus halodenitrificans TaxID=1482 RepID=UPI0038B59046
MRLLSTEGQKLVQEADKLKQNLVEWRRQLHMYPELSFQEWKTSRYVADLLRRVPGLIVEEGIGYPTAIVGTLTSGSGPKIAIRADMDALPIQEENNTAYKSKNEGVMHACGHDAHTAICLGAAHLLGEYFSKGQLQGTVKFLFQPAEEKADEEGLTGAPYMIMAGVLDEMDAVIALHMSPEESLGEVKVHDGYSMANVDVFEAIVRGTGGHGAYPHLGTDPFWMLTSVLQVLYGIPSRRVSPLESAVISIGSIQSGSASNVIPSQVNVKGTIRSYQPYVREQLHDEVKKAFALVDTLGGRTEVTISSEDPALKNDPKINHLVRSAINRLYPEFKIKNEPFGLGGEDFAHMTQHIPGAMFFLGCAASDKENRDLHTPCFDIDENVLPVGTAILSETVRNFLS